MTHLSGHLGLGHWIHAHNTQPSRTRATANDRPSDQYRTCEVERDAADKQPAHSTRAYTARSQHGCARCRCNVEGSSVEHQGLGLKESVVRAVPSSTQCHGGRSRSGRSHHWTVSTGNAQGLRRVVGSAGSVVCQVRLAVDEPRERNRVVPSVAVPRRLSELDRKFAPECIALGCSSRQATRI
jgi:hypothetical protein